MTVEKGGAIQASDGAKVEVGGNVNSADSVAADNATVDIKGNVNVSASDGIYAAENANISVGGNVTAEHMGVSADHSNVTVNGNVTANEEGIFADKSNVTVDGSVKSNSTNGIVVFEGSDITVKGDVSGQVTGVMSQNSTVQVNGNVVGTKGGAVDAGQNSNVTIDGDASGDYGVFAEDSTVTVKGNVHSKGDSVVDIVGTDKTVVIVGGDVSSDSEVEIKSMAGSDSEIAISGTVKNAEKGASICVAIEDGKAASLPEIVVGEIEDINKVEVKNYKTNETVSDEVKQSILDSIKYIVNTNHASVDGKGTITVTKLDGGALDKDGSKTYDVAKATETLTVHVNVQEGYEVSDVKAGKATLTKNSDGSYSVTIPAGGGVNIEAVLKAIEKVKDNNTAGTTVINYSGRDSEGSSSSAPANKWVSSGSLWKYNKSNGSEARNEWQYLTYNGKQSWYFFDADGYMKTGLYTDAKGNQYYLDPTVGAQIGMMATGWVEVNGKWMFFNDGSVADVPVGCYVESMTR